jgi:hypothetical protein
LMWVGMSYAGLVALALKRRELLWVLLAPLLVTVLANFVGKWPLGAFRTNLYITPYVLPIALIGADFLGSTPKRGLALGSLVFALCLLPGFAFGFDLHGHKRLFTRDHYQREVIAKLKAYRERQLVEDDDKSPIPLWMEAHTYLSHMYYLRDHPKTGPKYRPFFDTQFRTKRVKDSVFLRGLRQRLRSEPRGVWIVTSAAHKFDATEKAAAREGKIVVRERIDEHHLILFVKPRR